MRSSLKVLVTGGRGLMGSRFQQLETDEFEFILSHRGGLEGSQSPLMDICDRQRVFKVVGEVEPDVVVHTAAETNVDRCEMEKGHAWKVNAEGTLNVALACERVGARMVYVSTDYVFDGEKGYYREEDETHPINYYGTTKLEGERQVSRKCTHYSIIRTSVLYGWHSDRNFATWAIDSLMKGVRIRVVDDHYSSPTLVDHLVEMIVVLMEKGLRGVYHVAGGERASRFEFAIKIARAFDFDETLITPVRACDLKAWVARRPRDSSLCVNKIQRDTGVAPMTLHDCLGRLRDLTPF